MTTNIHVEPLLGSGQQLHWTSTNPQQFTYVILDIQQRATV
eukprot:gene11415-12758_t